MGRRTALLIAAFLVAALGTGLVFAYVSHADDNALKGQHPVEILVAKTLIPAGTSGADAQRSGAFTLTKVARDSVAPGAISDITPISNLVALGPVFPGEQILAAKFGTAGQQSVLPIPGDKIAVSVQLTDPARVAGFVEPGSQVAVFVTLAPQAGLPGTVDTIRTLLPRATVIAVGPTTTTPAASSGEKNTEALPRAIMTLALSQRDAQRIILASQKGTLYFGLLTANSKTVPGAAIDLRALVS